MTEGQMAAVADRRAAAPSAPARPSAAVDALADRLLDGTEPSERVRSAILATRTAVEAHAGAPDLARCAIVSLAAELLVARLAEGRGSAQATTTAIEGLADTLEVTDDVATALLHRALSSAPQLGELPPTAAIGIRMQFLVDSGVAQSVSLWYAEPQGDPMCVLGVGAMPASDTAARRAALTAIGRSSWLRVVHASQANAVPVRAFSTTCGALVADSTHDPAMVAMLLDAAAAAIGPALERQVLLERNAERERLVTASSERRLTRLGFDLHDGPMQDVLALAAELRMFQRDVTPFIMEGHREIVRGRFDDAISWLTELDRSLRDVAHSLETSTVLSRPLGESIHRATQAFQERTTIRTTTDISGDVDSLTDSQRIVAVRGIQEALSNIRAHSTADEVHVTVRARRSKTEITVVDNGKGFDVAEALADSARRGRLGLIGMSERVRLLGGRFTVTSQVGGPTTVSIVLPRWEPTLGSGDERR